MNAPTVSLRRESGILWPLWAAVFGLMFLGTVFIFSATANGDAARELPWWRYRILTQLAAYGLGLAAAVAVAIIDYSRLARWSLVAYWGAILLLVLVLIPGVGADNNSGARRWLDVGPTQFQPAEFAKLAFLFALASFLARPLNELASPALFLQALGLALLPFALIFKQPDLGSAAVLLPIALVQMLVGGVPRTLLLKFVAGVTLVGSLAVADALFAPPDWSFSQLKPYQKQRLQVYFGIDSTPADATPTQRALARYELERRGYNARQAMISVGSGGVLGKGWRDGQQSALGYLPPTVAHNDFIFSVIGEESGFAGSVLVLGLYAIVLFQGIQVAGQARDRLGRILAAGVVALLFTHVFWNIAMNIKLMPVKGLPLPLLSAGGTSVLCSLIAVGILQNIHLHRRHY